MSQLHEFSCHIVPKISNQVFLSIDGIGIGLDWYGFITIALYDHYPGFVHI